jgi:hypothetical protein
MSDDPEYFSSWREWDEYNRNLPTYELRDFLDLPSDETEVTPQERAEYRAYNQKRHNEDRALMGLPPAPIRKAGGPPDPAIQAEKQKVIARHAMSRTGLGGLAKAALAKRGEADPSFLPASWTKDSRPVKKSGIDPAFKTDTGDVAAAPVLAPTEQLRSMQEKSKAVAQQMRLEQGEGGLGDQKAELQRIDAAEKGQKQQDILNFQEEQQFRGAEFIRDYDDLREEELYFNIEPRDIKRYKSVLAVEDDPNWTDEERFRLRVQQAEAQRRLDEGRSLNTAGPYKSLMSKFMAGLAVAAGSWAAVRTGRNPALEIFQNAIKNDILAQRDEASRRAGRTTRAVNAFDRINRIYRDDLQTTMTLSGLHYGKAADLVQAKIEQTKSKIEGQKLRGLYNELRRQEAAYVDKAKKEFALANQGISIGIKGIRWVGPPGITPDIKEVRLIKEAASEYYKYTRKLEEMKKFTGDYMAPWSQRLAKARVVWEDIISLAGKLGQKGVLQEFEREKLEEVVPEVGTFKEEVLDQLGAAMDQLKIQVEHDWRGYMEHRTHYKVSNEAFRTGEMGRAAE